MPGDRGPVKRLLPIVVAGVLALVAFASAFALNTGLKMALAVPDDVVLEGSGEEVEAPSVAEGPGEKPAASVPSSSRGLSRQQYVDAILRRNLFDSASIGKAVASTGAETAITNLSVRLLATMVAEPAAYSSALIAEEGKDNSAKGYGIGDKIQDAEIVAIEKRKVTLKRGDGNLEYLTMDDKVPAAPGGGTAVAAAPAEGALDGVTQLGENKYAVERRILDQYLSDLDALSKMARVIPHKGPDGEVDGYRLSGIRRNSPLQQLGIKNGDVIHNVNGTSLANMTDAMGAFQQLSGANNFSFDVSRRGQRQTMEYEIR